MSKELEEKFQNVISGKLEFSFTVLSLGMLVSRLKTAYNKDKTAQTMDLCIQELDKYWGKYKSILVRDLKRLMNA